MARRAFRANSVCVGPVRILDKGRRRCCAFLCLGSGRSLEKEGNFGNDAIADDLVVLHLGFELLDVH